jgi:hypothetical protein
MPLFARLAATQVVLKASASTTYAAPSSPRFFADRSALALFCSTADSWFSRAAASRCSRFACRPAPTAPAPAEMAEPAAAPIAPR